MDFESASGGLSPVVLRRHGHIPFKYAIPNYNDCITQNPALHLMQIQYNLLQMYHYTFAYREHKRANDLRSNDHRAQDLSSRNGSSSKVCL